MKSLNRIKERNFSGVFYSPSLDEVYTLVYEILTKEYESYSKKVESYSPPQVVAEVIRLYYAEYASNCELAKEDKYTAQGKFNLKSLTECVNQAIGIIQMRDFFVRPSYFGFSTLESDKHLNYMSQFKEIECTCEDDYVFAVGRLTEDTNTSDDDPYETAGGYRGYLSKKGTSVYFKMGLNGVYLSFEGSCTIDHYNNNFYGKSTGGGTTEYKYGERVETRTIHTKSYKIKDIIKEFNVTLEKMDSKKGKSIIDKLTLVEQETACKVA